MSIVIGQEKIGKRLFGRTNVLCRRIVIIRMFGYFDIKINARNTIPKMFKDAPKMETYRR